MTTTKPSAGAVRAAKAILDRDVRQDGPDLDEALARIIDAESGLAELLEACKRLLKFNEELCEDLNVSKHYPSADFARAAIAKAENPNATVQQVAPAGRWTEKGTV